MTLADTITETVKNIFGKVPTLGQLQVEDEARKTAEIQEARAAAHQALKEARERYDAESPGLQAACEQNQERFRRAQIELVQALHVLEESNISRTRCSMAFRNTLRMYEGKLKETAPAVILDFLQWCSTEFERLRLEGFTAISSGPDSTSGLHSMWVKSNSKSLVAKSEAIQRARAEQMMFEIEDPTAEIEEAPY